jgi:GDPmannose 4,6-dehydratase
LRWSHDSCTNSQANKSNGESVIAKTAFITGISGQDGAYLAKSLLSRGYRVIGAQRRNAGINSARLEELGVFGDIELVDIELLEDSNIRTVLRKLEPDEIYNLAAQSFVTLSFEQPVYTCEVDAISVLRLLEAVKNACPGAHFYQASTSEMFGKVQAIPQNETTPFYPRSPYGVAKLFAHWITVNYRETYGLFACSGILFNHESPLRGMEFVTRKVTLGLARVALGKQDTVYLGNLDAKRDRGFAGDYVEGMWLMMQQEKADDFVLATGRTCSVKSLVDGAAAALGFDFEWNGDGTATQGIDRRTGKTIVAVAPEFYRRAEIDLLMGDSAKAKRVLGWEAKTSLEELIQMMAKSDYDRVKSGLLRF